MIFKRQHLVCCRFFSALFALDFSSLAEQQRNAPQARKAHNGINDPAEDRTLPAKQPGNKIKLENAHKAPVQAADNGQDQRDGIHEITSLSHVDMAMLRR